MNSVTPLSFRLLQRTDNVEQLAALLTSSDPWRRLGFTAEAATAPLADGLHEVHLATDPDGAILGMAVIFNHGSLKGYLRALWVSEAHRGRGIGTALLRHIEESIFARWPNVFLCVSSFNTRAHAFYLRNGYEKVGEIPDFFVAGESEWLLRKTRGPAAGYRP